MAMKIKSFAELEKKINMSKEKEFLDMTYEQKIKWLENKGISFKVQRFDYLPSTGLVRYSQKNPFTGKQIYMQTPCKKLKNLKASCAFPLKGAIKLKKEIVDVNDMFEFIVEKKVAQHSSCNTSWKYSSEGIPVVTKADYEAEQKRNKEKSEEHARSLKTEKLKKEQELINAYNAAKDNEKIYFNDFVVLGHAYNCLSNEHDLEEINAYVKILNKKGEIKVCHVPAWYCYDCDRFFIEKWEYENLKDKGVPLCQTIKEEVYYYGNTYKSFNELAEESKLHKCGYNVSAAEDLSAVQRHQIIALVIESGIMKKLEVTSLLSWFIETKGGMQYMENAVSKWEEDRRYASRYNKGALSEVGISLIREKRIIKKVV